MPQPTHDEDVERVVNFVARLRRIALHPLCLEDDGELLHDLMSVKLTFQVKPEGLSSVEYHLVDEVMFESLAVRLRPLTLNDDDVSFYSALKALDRIINCPLDKWRRMTSKQFKAEWREWAQYARQFFPVFLAGVRVLVVSRGNPDTARALLQNLNIAAIFMATILPLAAAAALVLLSMAVILVIEQFRTRDELEKQGRGKNSWLQTLSNTVVLFILAGVFVWYAMPIRYVFFTLIAVTVLVLVFFVKWLITRLDTLSMRIGGVYLLALIVVALVLTLAQTGVWLPREQLILSWFRTGVVYVLTSDDKWTKYMDDATRQVHIVNTDAITRREAIHDDKNNWLNKTLSEWLLG